MKGFCPCLGLPDDADTHTSFPSNWNYCHHVNPQELIGLQYQGETCLTDGYLECPVYKQDKNKPLPDLIRAEGRHSKPHRLNLKIILMIFILLVLLALIGIRYISEKAIVPITGSPFHFVIKEPENGQSLFAPTLAPEILPPAIVTITP